MDDRPPAHDVDEVDLALLDALHVNPRASFERLTSTVLIHAGDAAWLRAGRVPVGSLRVIQTPGHSPGHVALLHEDSCTPLVGDALFHRGGTPEQGPAALSHDPGRRDASLAELPLDVRAVGFAHGAPLTGADVEVYQQFLSQVRQTSSPDPVRGLRSLGLSQPRAASPRTLRAMMICWIWLVPS